MVRPFELEQGEHACEVMAKEVRRGAETKLRAQLLDALEMIVPMGHDKFGPTKRTVDSILRVFLDRVDDLAEYVRTNEDSLVAGSGKRTATEDTEFLLQQYDWAHDDHLGVLKWALAARLKDEAGKPLDWKSHRFLIEILNDTHPYQVVRKPSQVGMTILAYLKSVFAAQVHERRVLFIEPTDNLAQEVMATKFTPLMHFNPSIRGRGINRDGTRTYRGSGWLSVRGGSGTDVSLSVDLIVSDETNRSNLNWLEAAESRLRGSSYAGRWMFSVPSRPGVGVDAVWPYSDQREWHVRCPECALEQSLHFDENVDKERGAYVCAECRAFLSDDDRRNGRWMPTVFKINGKPPRWHGYHISHLIVPWISAVQVIEAEQTMSKGRFRNFVLGLPTEDD